MSNEKSFSPVGSRPAFREVRNRVVLKMSWASSGSLRIAGSEAALLTHLKEGAELTKASTSSQPILREAGHGKPFTIRFIRRLVTIGTFADQRGPYQKVTWSLDH